MAISLGILTQHFQTNPYQLPAFPKPAGSRHACGLHGSRAGEVVARQRRTHPGDASTAGACAGAERGGGDGVGVLDTFFEGFGCKSCFLSLKLR